MVSKKKSARRKPARVEAEVAIDNASPGKVAVMNVSARNVFTEYQCLKPGEIGECSPEVADRLVAKGLAETI